MLNRPATNGEAKSQRDNLCNPVEVRFAKLCTGSQFEYREQSFFADPVNITSTQGESQRERAVEHCHVECSASIQASAINAVKAMEVSVQANRYFTIATR